MEKHSEREREASSQEMPPSSIQKRIDQHPHKRGICILCACTNARFPEARIEPCDAVERMRMCFEDKLGYLVIQVGTTITSQRLDEVLKELNEVQLPCSYDRVFFYYFGHATEESLCLVDKNVDHKYIIDQLQSMCPSHPVELFKIFLFDGCCTVSSVTTHPIQVHKEGTTGNLGGSEQTWLTKSKYPSSSNTLVINAADFNCKAFYTNEAQVHGCGLVTLYFTDLVPMMNASLRGVLAEVRKKVNAYTKTHPNQYALQVLVYEDRLMRRVNLLAESTGNARVVPKNVTKSPQALKTSVLQWRFAASVENRIQRFIVEATPHGDGGEANMPVSESTARTERIASLSSLKPSTTYHLKVVAEYEDGFQAESETFVFTTTDHRRPENIKVTLHYSGSPEAKVEWSFLGDFSELSHYIVKAQTDGKPNVELTIRDVREKTAILKPLHLSSKYTVTIAAVYRDGVKKESSAEFSSRYDLRAATLISTTLLSLDPPKVVVKWSHQGVRNAPLPTRFEVVAKNSGTIQREVVEDPRIHQAALELRHDTTYMLKVITFYREGIKLESEEVEFKTPCKDEGCPTEEAIPSDREFTTKRSVPLKICPCITISILLLASAMLTIAYAPYSHYLQGSENCQVNYILSNATIQCGYGNSLQYNGAEIKGCPVFGDVVEGDLNVWQIRHNELKLYSRSLQPVYSNGHTYNHSAILLKGWQNYTWKGSVIAGFCCVTNANEQEKSASLYMFRHSDDAFAFEIGNGVRNAILSQTIIVQPNKTHCFTKWGTGSPFTVTHSSYHFIGVDLPANMNYTANITLTQTFVNVSDYPNSKPKQFSQENNTHFTYPDSQFKRIDYLYICRAPPSLLEHDAHKSETESLALHVCTCNNPYPWMKPTVTSITAFGGFGVLYICSVVTCYCLYIKRRTLCANHHCLCCLRSKKTPRYVRIDVPSAIQA